MFDLHSLWDGNRPLTSGKGWRRVRFLTTWVYHHLWSRFVPRSSNPAEASQILKRQKQMASGTFTGKSLVKFGRVMQSLVREWEWSALQWCYRKGAGNEESESMRSRCHCPSHSAKFSSSWLTAKVPVALLRVGAAGEYSSMGSARRHLFIFSCCGH